MCSLEPPPASSDADIDKAKRAGVSRRGVLVRALVMVLAVGVLVAVYWPGLSGPFVFDDHGNIVRNPGVMMEELSWDYVREAALSSYGQKGIQRPLARISYALNYYFADQKFDRFYFKATNLIIHIINSFLLLFLMTMLLKAMRLCGDANARVINGEPLWHWFPLVVTLVWMLHPIQLTSILYVVQRMTSMAGTGVLVGIALFTYGRLRVEQGRAWGMTTMVLAVGLGTTLGVVSKENAILTPLFACLVELFFFNRRNLDARTWRKLKRLYVLVIGLTTVAMLTIALTRFDFIMSSYDVRNFTLLERLMTQSRVLFKYLSLIVYPDIQEFGLFHDDIRISTSLFSPWTTIISVIGWIVVIILAVWSVRTRNLFGFGALWYLSGHIVESSVLGLEIAHEHRNYIPSLGPLFAICFAVFLLITRRPSMRRAIVALVVCLLVANSFVTYTRATVWETRTSLLFFAVRNHPDSYRAHMGYGAALQAESQDIYITYSEYQKSGLLNKYNVLPVVRMQRIISGALNQLEEGSLSEEPAPEPASGLELFYSPLILNRMYLERLDELVKEEIPHRLSDYALDAETSVAIAELQRCIVAEYLTCPPMSRFESWLTLILEREDLTPTQRMSFLQLAARIDAYKGNLDASVASLEEALELTENNAPILIEIANTKFKLGEWESAWEMLDDVEQVVDSTGQGLRHFRELKALILEAKEEAQAAQQSSGDALQH